MELTIIRRLGGWLSIAVVMFAVAIILYSSAAAQTKRNIYLYGKASVVYVDWAEIGEKDTYFIKVKKGQRYRVEVDWKGEDIDDNGQGLSGLTIVYPSGKTLVDAQDGYLQADTAGHFKIIVSPKTRKTSYRYRIRIEKL